MSLAIMHGVFRCLSRDFPSDLDRDHVELPEDFHLKAEEIKEQHMLSPVQDARRGEAGTWSRYHD